MKRKLKTISALLIIALLFSIVVPIIKVGAVTEGYLTFNGASRVDDNTVSYTYDEKTVSIQLITLEDNNPVPLRETGTEVVYDKDNINNYALKLTSDINDSIAVQIAGNKYNPDENGLIKFEDVNAENISQVDGVFAKESSTNIGGDPQPQENEDYEDIKINATFNNARGEIILNGKGTLEATSYNITLTKAGYTDSSKTNRITINTAFGENIAKKITINNNEYDINNTDSNTFEVAGAETYTIVVDGEENLNAPRTLIWANPDYVPTDEEDAEWVSQFSIKHGSAKIIAVYDENGNKLNPSEYTNQDEQPDGSKSDEYGLRNGFGWIKVKPGYQATFEFYPEYGYQLTSVAINQQPMNASTTTNQFTVEIPNGNLQFAAEFTKTDDIVKAKSEKVSSGEISLGNTLEGGTAQLTVNDVELSQDKITGFENAAGDYTISNYLDIDLYNVFYKGKADSDDVWSNKIDELDNEATITLQLAEGVNADDIVIVHNIHDGDEYEVIEIQSYDAETNTITFKTKSFSNYAIATKTTVATDTKTEESKVVATISNPTTGDHIRTITTILVIATLGLFATMKFNKNRKVRKH